MNRALAETIIRLFRDTGEDAPATLRACNLRTWNQTLNWLDASGMALYFAQHVRGHGLENALPPEITARLQTNLADNARRTSQLFDEFARINQAFQNLCLAYAVVKGFALVPDYCPEPSLRYQLDFDFLVHRRDSSALAGVMDELGYELASDAGTVWHFKKGEHRLPRISQLYEPRPQLAVELHFVDQPDPQTAVDVRPPTFLHVKTARLNDVEFPVLADVDAFVGQATHLFKHMRSEWTRASWVLEFRRFLVGRAHDRGFWHAVNRRTAANEGARLAIAAAIAVADVTFGPVPHNAASAIFAASDRVRCWIDLYWRDILLSNFPGSKLYLLLERELTDPQEWKQLSRSRLYPLHRTPRVVHVEKSNSRPLGAVVTQMRFAIFRMRFHLVEGLRYWRESRRWKRSVADIKQRVDLCAQIAREVVH